MIQSLHIFINKNFSEKSPLMKKLKSQFRILRKPAFDIDSADLLTQTKTLSLKRAHTQDIYKLEKFRCLLIFKSHKNLAFHKHFFSQIKQKYLFYLH